MKTWLEACIHFIFPAKCRVCGDQLGLDRVPYICDTCWDAISFPTDPLCQICGIPTVTIDPTSTISCRRCQTDLPPFRKLRSIAFYDGAIRSAILLFKYQKKRIFSKYLIDLLKSNLPIGIDFENYDFSIPIPLHRKRLRERGFNQAELIAKGIEKIWNLEVRSDLVFRIKNTKKLSLLESSQERSEVIKNAFRLRLPEIIENKRILIIDDIYTTGTTIREVIGLLRSADPEFIDVLTIARAK